MTVHFIGAGPGAPDLLTLRAARLLEQADVILHDHLAGAEILDLARRDAERINVGKQAGGRKTDQDTINALLVAHASKGMVVAIKACITHRCASATAS